jgi:hypothetical protein
MQRRLIHNAGGVFIACQDTDIGIHLISMGSAVQVIAFHPHVNVFNEHIARYMAEGGFFAVDAEDGRADGG